MQFWEAKRAVGCVLSQGSLVRTLNVMALDQEVYFRNTEGEYREQFWGDDLWWICPKDKIVYGRMM